jgi:hypothetical protein
VNLLNCQLFALTAFVLVPVLSLFAAEPPAKTLVPPESLVLDGVPPIPAEIAEQVGRYTESRAATFLDWHPSKPEMLILTRFGDTNQVHLVTQPGGARTQLTFFADRVNDASFDPQAGAFFVFSKSAGGNVFNQNYRYDFATGEVALLTDGKSIYLEDTPGRVIDLLKNARQPMFLVCVTDQVKRMTAVAERKPARSETGAPSRKSKAV